MILKRSIIILLLIIYTSNNFFAQVLEIPEPTNISVNLMSGMAEISWKMKQPEMVDGYIIKREIFGQPNVVDGSFNTVGTVNDNTKFSYIDSGDSYGYAMPNSRVETYRLVAYKNSKSGKILYSNMSRAVSTLYLSPIEFDLCAKQNTLRWTAFNGFGNSLKSYHIYYSNTKNGEQIFLGEIPASDTSFIHTEVEPNAMYYYHIKAIGNDTLTSCSNIQVVNTEQFSDVKLLNANYASVIKKGHIEVSFTVDKTAKIKSYILLKSTKKEGKYDTILHFAAGKEIYTYIDTLRTNKNVVYYKLAAINECGYLLGESNIANNISLKARASKTEAFINNLSWNEYEDWRGGVETYIIYRKYGNGDYEKIAELPSDATNYVDNIQNFITNNTDELSSSSKFCYFVEAVEDWKNPYGIVGKSRSNKSCTHQEAVVYLPNAINPKSNVPQNREFRPVTSFVSDYKLIIYNRWGGIVFQSNDPLQAWDGRKNGGDLLMKGTYVYFLQYRSKNKEWVKRSGEINLIY